MSLPEREWPCIPTLMPAKGHSQLFWADFGLSGSARACYTALTSVIALV